MVVSWIGSDGKLPHQRQDSSIPSPHCPKLSEVLAVVGCWQGNSTRNSILNVHISCAQVWALPRSTAELCLKNKGMLRHLYSLSPMRIYWFPIFIFKTCFSLMHVVLYLVTFFFSAIYKNDLGSRHNSSSQGTAIRLILIDLCKRIHRMYTPLCQG